MIFQTVLYSRRGLYFLVGLFNQIQNALLSKCSQHLKTHKEAEYLLRQEKEHEYWRPTAVERDWPGDKVLHRPAVQRKGLLATSLLNDFLYSVGENIQIKQD